MNLKKKKRKRIYLKGRWKRRPSLLEERKRETNKEND
jgi:hypothetical protein